MTRSGYLDVHAPPGEPTVGAITFCLVGINQNKKKTKTETEMTEIEKSDSKIWVANSEDQNYLCEFGY